MTHKDLKKHIGPMRESAIAYVQQHAKIRAPHVPEHLVESICHALGAISVDEATAALDDLELELRQSWA